jgi:AbiU2
MGGMSVGQAHWVPDDAKPMAADSRVRKWKRWIENEIRAEVLGMNNQRAIYEEVGRIVKENGELPPSHFFNFLRDTYGATQALAVRRQAEVGTRVISLATLLAEIAGDPERLSREWFLSHYDSYARAEVGVPVWAEKFGGNVGDHVDPDLVRADLGELRGGTAKTKDLVDKHLAHTDKKPLKNPPTFKELHDAVETVNKQFQKYVLLLTVSSYATLVPVAQYDWLAIFREPWIR